MSNNRYDIDSTQIKDIGAKLLYITTSSYGKDWNSLLHMHHFSELFYVVRGKGEFIVEEKRFPVKEDDLVIINSQTLHTEVSVYDQPLEYVALGIEGLSFVFQPEEEEIKNYSVFNYRGKKNEFWFYFKTLTKEIQDKPKGYETVCQNVLEILLLNLMRDSNCTFALIPTNRISKECTALKQYIDTHFKENITLDQLADVIHMNKFYLTHTFRKTYGMAPIAYMIGKRIEESKYLLENTDFSLSQISDIVGFSSPSYFSQTFKRTEQESPKEYRDRMRQTTKA